MPFFDPDTRPSMEIRPGVTLRTTWLNNMLLSYIALQPNAPIPPHHHPQEQISVILQGEVTITVDGETRLLRPGDVFLAPADAEHGGQAGPEGATMIDVFSPLRQELQFQP